MERVDCNDPRAVLVVTSQVKDTYDGRKACASDPQATASYQYKSTVDGATVSSFVLCLAKK